MGLQRLLVVVGAALLALGLATTNAFAHEPGDIKVSPVKAGESTSPPGPDNDPHVGCSGASIDAFDFGHPEFQFTVAPQPPGGHLTSAASGSGMLPQSGG